MKWLIDKNRKEEEKEERKKERKCLKSEKQEFKDKHNIEIRKETNQILEIRKEKVK